MWQIVRAYQTVTNNVHPHSNAVLLLVSGLDYTMRIVLYPLALFVNIDDTVFIETCLFRKEQPGKKENFSTLLNKTTTKLPSCWKISRHVSQRLVPPL
jgi:hypothetical protein